MTQPAQPTFPAAMALPDPTYPMVVHMISNPMFPAEPAAPGTPPNREEPVHWVISKNHPFVPNFRVMRMFLDRGGVEVYSVFEADKIGMRDVIPMHNVRLVQESMPIDIFVEELAAAEEEDGDEPDLEPEPEPEPTPGPAPVANGQAS